MVAKRDHFSQTCGCHFADLFPRSFSDPFSASILASFWEPFGINFRYFFGIDFWMPFWMPFFRFLTENGSQKERAHGGRCSLLAPQGRPKTLQKRIRDATSIFYRFWTDFGGHFGDFRRHFHDMFMVLACFFDRFLRWRRQY